MAVQDVQDKFSKEILSTFSPNINDTCGMVFKNGPNKICGRQP